MKRANLKRKYFNYGTAVFYSKMRANIKLSFVTKTRLSRSEVTLGPQQNINLCHSLATGRKTQEVTSECRIVEYTNIFQLVKFFLFIRYQINCPSNIIQVRGFCGCCLFVDKTSTLVHTQMHVH